MAADFDNVVGGPADFQLASTSVGHTAGGIEATISPQNRPVNVDKFGVGECNIRHTGDEVRMNVPFAEWVAAQIAEVYEPGNDQTAAGTTPYMGIGRSAGYIYTAQTADIIPFLSADAAKKLIFNRVTPIGEFSLMFNSDDDRVFEVEYACLIKEDETDGELIGKIQVST